MCMCLCVIVAVYVCVCVFVYVQGIKVKNLYANTSQQNFKKLTEHVVVLLLLLKFQESK